MDFYQVVSSRRSIRKYKSVMVEDEKLGRILEAARMAPSAANRQPLHFIVIKDEKIKTQLKEAYSREWFYTAPLIIGVCSEPSESWVRKDGKKYGDIDAAIAFEHLVLAATSEGLGTCWVGAFDPHWVRKIIALPPEIEPIAFTPLGYPDETPPAKERKPLQKIVHWNGW